MTAHDWLGVAVVGAIIAAAMIRVAWGALKWLSSEDVEREGF